MTFIPLPCQLHVLPDEYFLPYCSLHTNHCRYAGATCLWFCEQVIQCLLATKEVFQYLVMNHMNKM